MDKKEASPVGSQKSKDRSGKTRLYARASNREVKRGVISTPKDFDAALEELGGKTAESDLVMEVVPDPADMNKTATSGWGREFVRAGLERYLLEDLKARLSPQDWQVFQDRELDIQDNTARHRIHWSLDEVIIQAGLQQGPLIFLVPIILRRVCDWTLEDDGLRWSQLSKQFALIGPVMRGRAKAPLNRWWVDLRKPIREELKVLQETLRELFPGNRVPPPQMLLDVALETVIAKPSVFAQLNRLGDAFHLFVAAHPREVWKLLLGKSTPAEFRDELIAWITNRKAESVRQSLSGMAL